MNAEQKPNTLEGALEELRRRRDKLDVAIAAIEELVGGGQGPTQAATPPAAALSAKHLPTVGTLPSDAFFGMSITDAVRKYLGMVRAKQSPSQIAAALEHGGLHNTSKNFPNTVRSIMARSERGGGDIVRVGKLWGLTEWYPGMSRAKRGKNGAAEAFTEIPPAEQAE